MRKRKRRIRRSILKFLSFVTLSFLIFLAMIFAIIFLPNRLVQVVTIEAGEVLVLSESQFIISGSTGVFSEDAHQIDLSIPGTYDIKIKMGFMTYKSKLIILDTQPPEVVLRMIISPLGKAMKPQDFIESAIDNTLLSYRFVQAPDPFTVGVQEVKIAIMDLGFNEVIETTSVLVSQIKDKVTLELGSPKPTIDAFLMEDRKNEQFITDIDKLKLSLGTFDVEILIEDRILISQLEVVDTIPPTATVLSLNAFVGDKIEPKDFIRNIVDASKVTLRFKENINYTAQAGTYNPIIVLTDEGNNTTELTGKIVVIKDTEPPVLSGSGLNNRSVYVGDSFNYNSQVFAVDNRDGRVSVSLSGSVDFLKAGIYPLTFRASDKAGNTASKVVTITVMEIPPFVAKGDTGNSDLNNLVDQLFSDILDGRMSTYQVTLEIFRFGRTIRYQAGPLASEWTQRAITTLTTRNGNCFGRMYAMRAMFTRAGITNRERIQYDQDHSWNQVNIGNGWQNIDIGFTDTFLVSDAYLKNKALSTSAIKDNNWDTEPPIVGTVMVEHLDEATNLPLVSTIVLTGNVGLTYTTQSVLVSGYAYLSRTSNHTGTYTESMITVIYRYRKDD